MESGSSNGCDLTEVRNHSEGRSRENQAWRAHRERQGDRRRGSGGNSHFVNPFAGSEHPSHNPHKTSSIMKSIALMTIILVIFLSFFSCIYANSSKEEKKADIVGTITNITQASDEAKRHGRLCTLMVVGVEPDGTEDRAMVTVTSTTHILTQGRQPAGLADLKEGLQVEVKFKGPVFASHPVMATAGEVRILGQTDRE